eukprot:350149-Chlamydomonas_euryale.AAC.18
MSNKERMACRSPPLPLAHSLSTQPRQAGQWVSNWAAVLDLTLGCPADDRCTADVAVQSGKARVLIIARQLKLGTLCLGIWGVCPWRRLPVSSCMATMHVLQQMAQAARFRRMLRTSGPFARSLDYSGREKETESAPRRQQAPARHRRPRCGPAAHSNIPVCALGQVITSLQSCVWGSAAP